MRTAVLISGQMRSFASCVRNANWHLYRRLIDPIFFVSCANDDQAHTAEFLREFARDVHIEVVDQPTIVEPSYDLIRHAPYAPALSSDPKTVVQSILRQLWHRQRVYQFLISNKAADDVNIVVRCRPDLLFQGLELPADVASGHILEHRIYAPWKATCGGVNDRLGIMSRSAAAVYFNLFAQLFPLLDRGCPLHPESLLRAALEQEDVQIRNTLLAEFTTIRLDGPDVELIEYPGELARFIQTTIEDFR